MLFQAARPILLNGIENFVSRADLADRAIFLTLAPIAEQRRRSEAELWREFERARPAMLGALLDAVAHGFGRCRACAWPAPRMADLLSGPRRVKPRSGQWHLVRCYETNRRASIDDVVDADPVAAWCRDHGHAQRLDRKRDRLLRAGADLINDGHSERRRRLAQKSARARRPPFAGLRPSCGQGHRHASAVKAAPGIGSSGCVRPAKIPSAPSAVCARWVAIRRRTTSPQPFLVSESNHGPG